MSVGLVTKNPVSVVGFAKQQREPGLGVREAAQPGAGALRGRRT